VYGNKENPIVKYYDISFALSDITEINWFVSKAEKYGGPVLDLAGGTGRLSIALAEQGFDVVCLDSSKGMQSKFKEKLENEYAYLKQKITIVYSPMDKFDLKQKFNTVICCDAFFHNLTKNDQINCLNSIHNHLNCNGGFVFNIPKPTAEFIMSCKNSNEFTERGRYSISSSEDVLVIEELNQVDGWNQTVTNNLKFKRLSNENKIISIEESKWQTRYMDRSEAEKLLKFCNFKIVKIVGNYQNGDLENNTQMIFEVIK